ncbi:glycosyltransferase family 9 protein [Actinoplanes rectilineatus]|uniref:glycosyltransferase family 9 protein n=1 Tax=Actinoplanes rectilineatus TaxID=113571 RepID=UPI0005F2D42D|nr:glycosyltransferase family 9 protein [Actinoplanes rectilineatus]
MILALRALGAGDLARAAPALRALRSAFPGETLAVAAPARLAPLAAAIGGIDRIVPAGELEPLDAAPAMPRLAVNLHGSGPGSHRRLQALRPGELWAFASRPAGHHDGPGWHDEEHEVRRWCRLIRYYGVPCDESDLDLSLPATQGSSAARGIAATQGSSDTQGSSVTRGIPATQGSPVARRSDVPDTGRPGASPVMPDVSGRGADAAEPSRHGPGSDISSLPERPVLLYPGAPSPGRRWPLGRFATVADRLRRDGHHVLITGSPADRDLCTQVAVAARFDPDTIHCPDLEDLLSLVARAALVISGDAGTAALAVGFRTPSVTLYGPISPALCGPPPDRQFHRTLWHGTRNDRGDLPGPPHPALLKITEDEVLTEAAAALSARPVAATP